MSLIRNTHQTAQLQYHLYYNVYLTGFRRGKYFGVILWNWTEKKNNTWCLFSGKSSKTKRKSWLVEYCCSLAKLWVHHQMFSIYCNRFRNFFYILPCLLAVGLITCFQEEKFDIIHTYTMIVVRMKYLS